MERGKPTAKSVLQDPVELDQRTRAVIDPLIEQHKGEEIRYTQCFLNGCFTSNCIGKFHIKDGKLVAIEPDDTIHPNVPREEIDEDISTGMIQLRPCAMGHAWKEDVYSPSRIVNPMMRVGKRGEGKFVPISWEVAIDIIAEKLRYVKEKYGPYSIAQLNQLAWDTCAFELAPWFGAGVGGWTSISFGGPDTAQQFWMGYDMIKAFHEPGQWGLEYQDATDLLNSKLIVLWGWNTLAYSYQVYPYYLKQARERGIPIICIDPIYNWTAETLADQWIPIRPSTDLAMELAIADVLLREDLYDHDFVGKWVEPEGFRKFRDYIFGQEDGQEKTPEWAEGLCGVPAETIREFARLYASSKPCALRYAVSCGRQHRGEYGSAMAIILQALTGNSIVPGGWTGGVEFGLTPPFPTAPFPELHMQRTPEEYKAPTLLAGPKWPDAILLREKFDKGEMSLEEYNRAIGNEPGNPPPNIQMLIFQSHHLNNFPDVNKRIEAIKKVEFSFGFHYSFEQVTPRYEDIVLPALFPFETNDDYFWRDIIKPISPFMIPVYGVANVLSYQAKVIDPPGDIRPREWFWVQVANKLGIGEKYNPRLYNVPLEKWDEATEAIHKEAYEEFASNPEVQAAYGGKLPSWEEFKAKPILRVPVKEPHYAFKEEVEAGRSPFRTPSAKIEFYATMADKIDLPNTRYAGHLDPLPRWEVSYMKDPPFDSFFHPKAKEYPLLMVTPVTEYRQHSLHDNNPLLRDDCYRHALWISVADAKVRGIKDDDMVRVYNDRGEVVVPAYVTNRVAPGVVALYHGAWYTPDGIRTERMPDGVDRRGAPNLLISDEYGPHNMSAFLTTALIQVEKL